uniref:Putative peptide transporter family 1-like isoform x2 n=1 Tax=Panstrongylus lignarius TaxID=156445 RepID=A0A224XE90_9HEMI
MDNRIFGFNLYPEMIFILMPLCSSALFPVFLYGVFPLMDRIRIFRCVLDRVAVGFLLAVLSYAGGTFLEAYIETSRLLNPGTELGQIAIVNGCNCSVTVLINAKVDYIKRTIKPLDKIIINNLECTGVHIFDSVTDVTCHNKSYSNFYNFKIVERKSLTYLVVLAKGEIVSYLGPQEDVLSKDSKYAVVRIFYYLNHVNSTLLEMKGPQDIELLLHSGDYKIEDMFIMPGNYDILLNKQVKGKNIMLEIGGIYTILIVQDSNDNMEIKLFPFVEPNLVHMFWLIPQMLLLLFAEMFVSNNCIAYFFHKTANDMKVVVMSFWLASCSIGNLIVTLDASLPFSASRKLYIFLQYTCLMILDTATFLFISANLKADEDRLPFK